MASSEAVVHHVGVIRQVIDTAWGQVGPRPPARGRVGEVVDTLAEGLQAPAAILWTRVEDGSWRIAHRRADSAAARRALRALTQEAAAGPSVEPERAGAACVWRLGQHRDEALQVPGARSGVAVWIGPDGSPVGLLELHLAAASVEETTTATVEIVAALLGGWLVQEQELAAARRERDRLAAASSDGSHNGLTGLPDRASLCARLDEEWAIGRRHGQRLLLAVLDLVRFTDINDRFGSQGGDRVLLAVAERLQTRVHHTLVGRLAGDDFAVVVAGEDAEGWDAALLAQEILAAFEAPFELAGHQLAVKAAVGATEDTPEVESARALLRDAELALRVAKRSRGSACEIFRREMLAEALQRVSLEADLRRAVEQGQLQVAYQPIVDLTTEAMCGLEALARWDRPGHGPVGPEVFIPAAEEQDLIQVLGSQVLLAACQQLHAWRQDHATARRLRLWVNVAAAQLDDPDLVPTVEEALARSGLEADQLVLEITESAMARDKPMAMARLWELRERGVGLAIDDFGTGQSSLARLRDLPADRLKIDRSFLHSVTRQDRGAPLLDMLFGLSHSLGLAVVAEGVETPTQLAAVLDHGCEAAQGYLFAHPLRGEEVAQLLADPRWDLGSLGAGRPGRRMSPHGRLSALLDDLAGQQRASADQLEVLLGLLAELSGLESVYLTHVDVEERCQRIVQACNRGSLSLSAGQELTPLQQGPCPVVPRALRRLTEATHPEVLAQVAPYEEIRTYLAAPVVCSSGAVFGTLCGTSTHAGGVADEAAVAFQAASRALGNLIPPATVAPATEIAGRGMGRAD